MTEQTAPNFGDTSGIVSEDSLAKARKLGKEFFDLDKEIEDLEETVSTKKARRLEISMRELPTLFGEIQLDKVGLPEDNVDIVVGPYYKASISAEWPPEQIEEGFKVLEELDGGDIIRATLTVEFLKEEYEDALELQEFIRTNWPKANMHPSRIAKAVPWNTLTSFVRDYVEDESTDPLTEEQKKALGATIGLVAKIKKRKTK